MASAPRHCRTASPDESLGSRRGAPASSMATRCSRYRPLFASVTGIRVVADVDEEVFAVPEEHRFAVQYREAGFEARASELIRTVDALFVPSDRLAARLSRYSSKISVTPNGLDLAVWRKTAKPKTRDRVQVIGFAGTATHTSSIEILRPVLAKPASRFAERGACNSSVLVSAHPGFRISCPARPIHGPMQSRGLSGPSRQVGF